MVTTKVPNGPPATQGNGIADRSSGEQLPVYTAASTDTYTNPPPPVDPPADDKVNINSAFELLTLSEGPSDPDPNTCLAHLKLLFAFQTLKTDVGYTDGLWGLWDASVDGLEDKKEKSGLGIGAISGQPQGKQAALSALREKRWAIYLARAVDRYEAWWESWPKKWLTMQDMDSKEPTEAYAAFPHGRTEMRWKWGMQMPLDVLMVLHSHMLNPRAFLEDCIRHGHRGLWHVGMPWDLVNASIDTNFSYQVSDHAKAEWVARTERSWENIDDPIVKSLKCPACNTPLQIPWTTCGQAENVKIVGLPDLVGQGYGDGNLQQVCHSCSTTVDKDLLSVAKFVNDSKLLLSKSVPMPGTILELPSGMPEANQNGIINQPRTWPNRIILKRLRSEIIELLQPRKYERVSMESVKIKIERAIADTSVLMDIDGVLRWPGRYNVDPLSKMGLRKMMSRYWENFSPFALDLCSAVVRQGSFVEKMYKIDWLHSPSASSTMSRLIAKYLRFFAIMEAHPRKMAVPTLDVDLAWHTAQLSPKKYYDFSKGTCRKFIDHDDKIDETKLSDSFEWTSKTYQETFGEVYSECTCWYCETIRAGHISTVGGFLGVSKNEKVAENFHASGTAKLCPPDKSAHISSHSAIKTLVDRRAHAMFNARLDQQYEKACRRAEKKGRKPPTRAEAYDHWGYGYAMYAPFVYPMYLYPGMYYMGAPGYVGGYGGVHGGCAAGTCSAGVSGGACGGPGGCGGCGSGGCSGGGGCGGGGS